jgi:DNA-3-methyladenine glycosylase
VIEPISAAPGGEILGIEELLVGPVLDVARRLIGWRIQTTFDGRLTEVAINETEAYAGDQDPASHAFNGATKRNLAMFGPPGTLYVYRSYGLHWCMNVVVGDEGVAHAVLLRGGTVTQGEGMIRERRGRSDHLTDGPGKLCQALGVTGDHDGTSLATGPVRLVPGEPLPGRILATPRVGISKAVELPWRFVVAR